MENPKRPKKINVPTQYKEGAKILRQMVEEGKSLKNLIYSNSHIRASALQKLIIKLQENETQLEEVIKATGIFDKEKFLNPWLGRILIAELLYGRGQLNGESKPVQCVLSYNQALKDALAASGESTPKQQKYSKYKVPRYVRVNTLIYDRKEAIEYAQNQGWKLLPREDYPTYEAYLEGLRNLKEDEFMIDFHIRQMLVFPHSSKKYWSHNDLRLETKLLLQDKASCLPTFLLAPTKKSVCLDCCAAPGLKTCHLAAIMKNKGKIFAVERDEERFKLLKETVENAKATIVQPILQDFLKITNDDVPNVEYILLDPSCSGSGMLNRFEQDVENKDADRLYKLQGLQHKLLVHAMNSFPGVQKIVYSTCSLYPEENEEVVLGALRHSKDFKLANASELLGGEWLHKGSDVYTGIGENCIYARTETDLTIGFFVAVMVRCDEGESNEFYMEKQNRKRQFEKNPKAEGKDNKFKQRKRQREQ